MVKHDDVESRRLTSLANDRLVHVQLHSDDDNAVTWRRNATTKALRESINNDFSSYVADRQTERQDRVQNARMCGTNQRILTVS